MTPQMTPQMIWLDGILLSAADARISTSDRGLLLGDGLFETIRVAQSRPQHLSAHLRRMVDAAGMLAIAPPFEEASIQTAIDAVIGANGLRDGSLRLTLTRGPGPRGVLPSRTTFPTLMITAANGAAADTPMSVIIATVTRRNEWSPLSRVKSLNYLDSILARGQAVEQGADEAILLNTRGLVAEASCANLLVLKDGAMLTPPVADGALPGIIRDCLIAKGMVCEQSLAPDALFGAEALFLCSSLAIRAIDRIDGMIVSSRPDRLAGLRRRAAFGDYG